LTIPLLEGLDGVRQNVKSKTATSASPSQPTPCSPGASISDTLMWRWYILLWLIARCYPKAQQSVAGGAQKEIKVALAKEITTLHSAALLTHSAEQDFINH
jgi:tyrosyl-tRNA synthetase